MNDFEDRLYAFDEGDYEEALEIWKPLAEQGHIEAQYYLGEMYLCGDGVTQHYRSSNESGPRVDLS